MNEPARRSILVVDPDPRTAESIRAALPSDRYQVVAVGDPAKALSAVRERSIDALMSELVLPDASGLHLLVEARLRHPLLPRIVVTALEDFDAAVTAINEAEVFRFLRKPLDPAAVLAAVGEALGRAATLSQARGVEEGQERRRLALLDLEIDFPGISVVSHSPDGHFIPPQRLKGLAERLRGTPLGELLASSMAASREA